MSQVPAQPRPMPSASQPFSGFSSVSKLIGDGSMQYDGPKPFGTQQVGGSQVNRAFGGSGAFKGFGGAHPVVRSATAPSLAPSLREKEYNVSHNRQLQAKAAPSFTDSVRLQARTEDLSSIVRPDGTAPRPNANLSSFQGENKSAANLLSMLPAGDSGAEKTTWTSTSNGRSQALASVPSSSTTTSKKRKAPASTKPTKSRKAAGTTASTASKSTAAKKAKKSPRR
jgi:hypothetical protein